MNEVKALHTFSGITAMAAMMAKFFQDDTEAMNKFIAYVEANDIPGLTGDVIRDDVIGSIQVWMDMADRANDLAAIYGYIRPEH